MTIGAVSVQSHTSKVSISEVSIGWMPLSFSTSHVNNTDGDPYLCLSLSFGSRECFFNLIVRVLSVRASTVRDTFAANNIVKTMHNIFFMRVVN